MASGVCSVGAYPQNGDGRQSKCNACLKTVLVTADVEDDDLMGEEAGCRVARLDIVRRPPCPSLHIADPIRDPLSAICVFGTKTVQQSQANYSHLLGACRSLPRER